MIYPVGYDICVADDIRSAYENGYYIILAKQVYNMIKSYIIMTDQLARAATSIGANIFEAQYAQSKKDFVSKLEIALKEANETSYWLKLMFATCRIDEQTYKNSEKLCGNIRRLLIASCKTAKESKK